MEGKSFEAFALLYDGLTLGGLSCCARRYPGRCFSSLHVGMVSCSVNTLDMLCI